ncbi:hypothetical protein ACERIT_07040 [Halopenitus sp. H-Gu1]|uniref:hypothetical protein n=1 Tax=Halopenitus sp. H-Gu1 TaxID=3242697 RepID=UPI00359CE4B7
MSSAASPCERSRPWQAQLSDFRRRPREPGLYEPPMIEDDDWWPGKAGEDR